MNQKKNVDAALVIIPRYQHDYPGYAKAAFLIRVYWLYARLPSGIRKFANAFLSRLKKAIFSK